MHSSMRSKAYVSFTVKEFNQGYSMKSRYFPTFFGTISTGADCSDIAGSMIPVFCCLSLSAHLSSPFFEPAQYGGDLNGFAPGTRSIPISMMSISPSYPVYIASCFWSML